MTRWQQGPFAALGLQAETRNNACRPIEDALMNDGGAASIVTLPGGFEVWLVLNGRGRQRIIVWPFAREIRERPCCA